MNAGVCLFVGYPSKREPLSVSQNIRCACRGEGGGGHLNTIHDPKDWNLNNSNFKSLNIQGVVWGWTLKFQIDRYHYKVERIIFLKNLKVNHRLRTFSLKFKD